MLRPIRQKICTPKAERSPHEVMFQSSIRRLRCEGNHGRWTSILTSTFGASRTPVSLPWQLAGGSGFGIRLYVYLVAELIDPTGSHGEEREEGMRWAILTRLSELRHGA